MRCFFTVFALFFIVASSFANPGPRDFGEVVKQAADLFINYIKEMAAKMPACYKATYGRGVGTPIHICPAGWEAITAMCYPQCRDNYQSVGPLCMEHCRDGFTEVGPQCVQGVQIIKADIGGCPWYDKCGWVTHCSKCPGGWSNDGCDCRIGPSTYTRDTYSRGIGEPMHCADYEDQLVALCYPKCRSDYYGIGPVCWQNCPHRMPTDNGAICCVNQDACTEFIEKVSFATTKAVALCVAAGMEPTFAKDAIIATVQAAGAWVLLTCDNYLP